jgi:tRNA (mo5U34)-methyltransferase
METNIRPSRRGKDFSKELYEKGWYHSFELPNGEVIQGFNRLNGLKERYNRLPIPQSLAGRQVLDVGAWDGWFSFEAERHGAEVTAIDCIEVPNFLHVHRALSSKVSYRILDFYELPHSDLGPFDFVFFLGVLYHLKHPLLALEIVCGLTTDTAIVESFVTDGNTWRRHRNEIPTMEFYETDELGNQLDNWIGPSVACLLAMCRSAGFARVELLHSKGTHAAVACYRKWEPVGPTGVGAKHEPPELIGVRNSRTYGVNFSTRKEEYVSCWFRTAVKTVTREQLRFEISGFGVPALYVKRESDGAWMANFRLPPGLKNGWNDVRLRLSDTTFGRTLRIAVDMPPLNVLHLVVKNVCDGLTWRDSEISVNPKGVLSCWVKGLPENADGANVGVRLGTTKLGVEHIGDPDLDGYRQINAVVASDISNGQHALTIECGGVTSEPWLLKIISSC